MPLRRPALIFDFGNVVAHFDYRLACDKLGLPLGLSGESFLELARERGLTSILVSYESGQISSRAFYESVRELMELKIGFDEFANAWGDIFQINEPVGALLYRLKASGYKLILGSNTNEIHYHHFRRQLVDVLSLFDSHVLSYEIGHIKPSIEFYQACAVAADTASQDCVFIDDMDENVAGARAAGMRAIQYRKPAQLIDDLKASGIEIVESQA